MTPHLITVYHNTTGRFAPYAAGHELLGVISHCRHLPPDTDPSGIADWVFHVFNADLTDLQQARENSGGESALLLACTYRLLNLRSVSTGDVISVAVDGRVTWLACDPAGWRRITSPQVTACPPLGAAVYRRLREVRRG